MKVFYEGDLNGKHVKVDGVNVSVDATRYPVRNIAMVHIEKALPPNFTQARLVTLVAIVMFISPIFALIDRSPWFSISEWLMTSVLTLAAGLAIMLNAWRLIGLTFHSVKFGNSASDKDVAVSYPASQKMLKPYINPMNPLNWESFSASSYQQISKFANAVSDSIDSFQNQSQSSN
tara:strand:+ start:993 stop:1520 length:528 start_codon:yes stop_codon:yes gene_type:complete